MGASLGLALGNGPSTSDEYCEEDSLLDEVEDFESEIAYRRRVKELYCDASPEVKELLEEEYSYQEEDEIINSTPFVNEDGDLVKETTEGIVEIVEPYIISEEEYMDPTVFIEFERTTLIYYEKDDTLATDRDEVITNVEEMIGPHALTSFGSMTNNKDTVFVRNVKLGADFEIVRDEGSYQELVLGLFEEDSDYEKARKFFKDLDDGKD